MHHNIIQHNNIYKYVPTLYTPKVACLNFGVWGRVLKAVSHGKFQLDRFSGFGAPGGR